jgi:rhomboid family GlyGly-CTERM serine protease
MLLLLLVFNMPLLFGSPSTRFMFHADAVAMGEWWRLLTHPWVHVSWYHLLLDASAFLLAYGELFSWSRRARLGLLVAAAAGGLLTALAWSSLVWTHGLCGLSGLAHGLTAVLGLELCRPGRQPAAVSPLHRLMGWLTFLGVTGKAVIELFTGHILFESWHLGSLGTPIAGCHLGGILGALLFWWLYQRTRAASGLAA